jgi:protein pelota
MKDDFMSFFNTTIVAKGETSLVQNKSKFVRVSASSGHKNAIDQMLANDDIRHQLNDTKAAGEVSDTYFLH